MGGLRTRRAQRIYFAITPAHLDFVVLWSARLRNSRLYTSHRAKDYWSETPWALSGGKRIQRSPGGARGACPRQKSHEDANL